MYPRLTGLVAAPFTPFHADGELNLAGIERQAEHLVRTKVRGAFVCGTTGEGMSMTIDERKQVAKRWVEVAGKKLSVIVHIGHTSLGDVRELAGHAQKIGAHAVSAMGPCFFRPASVSDLVDYCRDAAGAASGLPFYYYHIPVMTGVHFAMKDFLTQSIDRVPTLAGVKFTHENLMDYRQCVTLSDGRFDILFGRDEILLAGLALGAKGAVGSTYNYAAPIYNKLMRCFEAGDLAGAQAQQTQAIEMIVVMLGGGGMAANKVMMKMVGVDCGPVRSPLANITDAQERQLRESLEAIGFFDHLRQ